MCYIALQVVIISHLGRPKPGKQSLAEMQRDFSLEPVAEALGIFTGEKFYGFVPECIGPKVEKAVANMSGGQVLCFAIYTNSTSVFSSFNFYL